MRQDQANTAEVLKTRHYDLDIARFDSLENARQKLQSETESLQAERNRVSKAIGAAKGKGQDAQALLDSVATLGERLKAGQSALAGVQAELHQLLSEIPNLPDDSVPLGKDENDNKETRRWGTPKEFDFEPLDHVDLGNGLGMMDYEMAANMAGSRFVVMYGDLARLHRALSQFMLDLHTRAHGYEETIVPVLLNPQACTQPGNSRSSPTTSSSPAMTRRTTSHPPPKCHSPTWWPGASSRPTICRSKKSPTPFVSAAKQAPTARIPAA